MGLPPPTLNPFTINPRPIRCALTDSQSPRESRADHARFSGAQQGFGPESCGLGSGCWQNSGLLLGGLEFFWDNPCPQHPYWVVGLAAQKLGKAGCFKRASEQICCLELGEPETLNPIPKPSYARKPWRLQLGPSKLQTLQTRSQCQGTRRSLRLHDPVRRRARIAKPGPSFPGSIHRTSIQGSGTQGFGVHCGLSPTIPKP